MSTTEHQVFPELVKSWLSISLAWKAFPALIASWLLEQDENSFQDTPILGFQNLLVSLLVKFSLRSQRRHHWTSLGGRILLFCESHGDTFLVSLWWIQVVPGFREWLKLGSAHRFILCFEAFKSLTSNHGLDYCHDQELNQSQDRYGDGFHHNMTADTSMVYIKQWRKQQCGNVLANLFRVTEHP